MHNGQRVATFDITGRINAPAIRGIRPAFEVWVPDGKGHLSGHFSMVWVAADGTYIKGEVDTKYSIDGVELEDPLYRRIEFSIDAGDQHLKQDERITLFGEKTSVALAA